MSRRKRRDSLNRDVNCLFDRQMIALQGVAQSEAINELGSDEVDGICFPDFMDRNDVRMIEC